MSLHMTPNTRPILGIDPGLTGGLALYDPDNLARCNTWIMPSREGVGGIDVRALHTLIVGIRGKYPELTVVVEKVHSLPRQAGAFNFGFGTGMIYAAVLLTADHGALKPIPPSQWKPAMGLQRATDGAKADTKDLARALAAELFPHIADQFKRKKDDGRAEALLLAVYYHNKMKKEGR